MGKSVCNLFGHPTLGIFATTLGNVLNHDASVDVRLNQGTYAIETANLTIESDYNYGGFHTTWMCADGEIAYCANPSVSMLDGGTYAKHALSVPSGRISETIANLWLGYGPPGFGKSLWPEKWHDDSEMNASRYAALAHVLLSGIYTVHEVIPESVANAFRVEHGQTLVEVQAPQGYVKALEGKAVRIDAAYNTWESPVAVEFEDMPQKGTITVAKHDSASGEPVDDSTYVVKAAADIVTPEGTVRAHGGDVVATLVTDGEGKATSPELYLGTYTVYEAKAKEGYALDVAEKTVTLEYHGQDIPVFDEELEVADAPTELKLLKVDALDHEKALEGAKFRLWNDEGTVDDELVTGGDGTIDVPHLEHGAYHLQETEAPQGYVVCDVDGEGGHRVHDITVNDQGMFQLEDGSMTAVLEMKIENMPKTMKTTAADAESGTHEGQARDELAIVDVIEYTGTVPGDEYRVTGKLMDKSTGEPALDDDGGEITTEATFTADDFSGTVEMEFEIDAAELAGRTTVFFEQLVDDEGNVIAAHEDMNDEGQSIRFPSVHTTAADGADGDKDVIADDRAEVLDTVAYENLLPGEEYVVTGALMDKATGEPLRDARGEEITATCAFTPEQPDGEVEVIYVHARSNGKRYELRVRAVDVVDAYQETLRTSFADDEERKAYLDNAITRSDLVLDGGAITGEAVWALATCSDQTGNSRTVVYASMSQPA